MFRNWGIFRLFKRKTRIEIPEVPIIVPVVGIAEKPVDGLPVVGITVPVEPVKVVAQLPDIGLAPPVLPETPPDFHRLLEIYLTDQGNSGEDIEKLRQIFMMGFIILDIGCGRGEIAWEIASKNPNIGVVATDKYDWAIPLKECSHYQKVGQDWKNRLLQVQTQPLKNLVLLKAEAEIISLLPDFFIDTVLLVNPEPVVGKAFVKFISNPVMLKKIKPGTRQIVIKPFCKEMGIMACGGYEFERSNDWSKGLGFLMESPLLFKPNDSIQWFVNLSIASPYSKNSTQTGVFIYGTKQTANPTIL